MFLDFSLCPGGAFVMHEDASEYDPNVAPPVEMHRQVVQNAITHCDNYDPVMKLLNKTRDTYDRLSELGSINLEPEDEREAVGSLDMVAGTATEVVNRMCKCLVKQRAMSSFISFDNIEWRYDSFITNAAVLLKHRDAIYRAGYDKITITSSQQEFISSYDVQTAFAFYSNTIPDMPEYPITLDNIQKFSSNKHVLSRFASIGDMFQCMYHDTERLVRLEYTDTHTETLDSLFEQVAWNPNRPIRANDDSVTYTSMIQWASRLLRIVKRNVYNMQCEILEADHTLSIDYYHKVTRSIISAVYSIFTWSMLWLIANAYAMRGVYNYRRGIDQYVEMIMNKIKNHEV